MENRVNTVERKVQDQADQILANASHTVHLQAYVQDLEKVVKRMAKGLDDHAAELAILTRRSTNELSD